MKRIICLVLLTLAWIPGAMASSTPHSLAGIDAYDPLQHAHLVVRGTVLDVSTERIKMSEWGMADVGMETSTMSVTRIRVAVTSVLRGEVSEKQIVFGAIGGLAPLFNVGHEYLVCARWRSLQQGGVYVTSPYVGLYSKSDNSWVRIVLEPELERAESLTDTEVDARIRSSSLASTVDAADVIARGRIKTVSQSEYTTSDGRRGELVRYTLEVTELLKGQAPGEQIAFVVARVAAYTPAWYRAVPLDILVGQEWYVFLRQGDEGLYPFGGPNSLLRIDGERVIYDNAIEYSSTPRQLDRLIRSEAGQ